MIIDLDKQGLVSLVFGIYPNYGVMHNELVSRGGEYYGGMNDGWVWDRTKLSALTEQELYYIYVICRNSYKECEDLC